MTAYNVISPSSLSAGQPEDVSVVLANLNAIASVINGQLDNANLANGAAIAIAKLAGYPADATKALLGDGSWGAAGMTLVTAVPGVPTDGQMIAYTDSLAAPTFVWPLRYNAALTRWLPFGEGWGFGAAFPAVPALVDKVTFTLTDNGVTPTFIWRFTYNLSNSSAFKWEFVGGSGKTAEVATAENCNSTAYVDLATVGPQITTPRAGVYEITLAFNWYGTNVASGGAVKIGAAATSPTEGFNCGAGENGAGAGNNITFQSRVGGSKTIIRTLAAADVLKMQYHVPTTTATFCDRALRLLPVRLS